MTGGCKGSHRRGTLALHKKVGPRRANDRPRGTEGSSFGALSTISTTASGALLVRAGPFPTKGTDMTTDTIRAALGTPGLALDERAQLMRMMRSVNSLAHREPLYAVDREGYAIDNDRQGEA
jgi:hypothetical protein